jgi:hypothetical protein
VQAAPHCPQWFGSLVVSVQAPEQQVAPCAHACAAVQPGTHRFAAASQTEPAAQSVSARQPTQVWLETSHTAAGAGAPPSATAASSEPPSAGAGGGQSALLLQPGWQVSLAAQ